MVIARKPQDKLEGGTLEEQDIERLITRGGAPAGMNGSATKPTLERKLRLYDERLSARLEDAVSKRPVKVSMNTWILEAIHEKLEREEGALGAR